MQPTSQSPMPPLWLLLTQANIPATTTTALNTETNRQFTAQLAEVTTYVGTRNALCQCIIEVVPAFYLGFLKSREFGHATNTPMDLLNHLDAAYGKITSDELQTNLDTMETPWHVDTSLETLWQQLTVAQQFAQDHGLILRAAVRNLEKSGGFTDALKTWRANPTAQQTFPNLQLHFNLENQNRFRLLTASQSNYLATAPIDVSPIACAAVDPKTAPAVATNPYKLVGHYYCHTHRATTNPTHTSLTCTKPSPGHRTDATAADRLGGFPLNNVAPSNND